MKGRNYTIDLLRLVASGWVVLFHLNEPFTHIDNPYRNMAKMGALGVPIFFVISGYCIGLAANNSKNVLDFLIRRFFRIFPAYWFSLFIVIICILFQVVFLGHNSIVKPPKSIGDISATLLLLTTPFSGVKTINWVYWSLTVEIFFYMVIGISILSTKRIGYYVILSVTALTFLPGIATVKGLFFLRDWAPFGLGLAVFTAERQTKKGISIVMAVLNCGSLFYWHWLDAYAIAALISLLIIITSVFCHGLPANPLSRLGDYAYSVYLLHVPLGVYLLGLLKSDLIQSNIVYNIAFDLAVLALMLLVASLVFKFLEMPGINVGKQVAKKWAVKPKFLTAIQS